VGAPLHNSQTGAAYVFTRSGTTWSQQQELTASDGAANDLFGSSVAINGSSAVIGAPHHNNGAAYVFVRPSSTWSQQGELTASDGASGDNFGQSVGMYGTTVVVGAPTHGGATGAAYVFVHPGCCWLQQAELSAADGATGDQFAASVAISNSTVVVGAPFHAANGAGYVFVRSGTSWSQQAELSASDGAAGDEFGVSVAIAGSLAVIGAENHNSNTGAAYVFAASGSTWTPETELTAADGAGGDFFGSSVAIYGSTALAGAPGKNSAAGETYMFAVPFQQGEVSASDGAANDSFGVSVSIYSTSAVVGAPGSNSGTGAAYVYVRSGSTWLQQAKLTASDGVPGDNFGRSVAIYGPQIIVVGAPNKNSNTGAAYVFFQGTSPWSAWSQQAELTASDAASGDLFGSSVAVRSPTVVVGAPGKNSNTGAAYTFSQSSGVWVQKAKLTAADGASNDLFGNAVATSGSNALVGAPGHNSSTGAAYYYLQVGASWPQETELTASDGASGDSFGWSVSIYPGTAVVGAPSHASTGAGYVFAGSGASWPQQAELSGGGSSVAVYGSTLLLGHAGTSGYALLFTRSAGVWSQQAELTASDAGAGDQFATSAGLFGGSLGILGAPGHNSGAGAAYVYTNL
jgi:hypothetical protein